MNFSRAASKIFETSSSFFDVAHFCRDTTANISRFDASNVVAEDNNMSVVIFRSSEQERDETS